MRGNTGIKATFYLESANLIFWSSCAAAQPFFALVPRGALVQNVGLVRSQFLLWKGLWRPEN